MRLASRGLATPDITKQTSGVSIFVKRCLVFSTLCAVRHRSVQLETMITKTLNKVLRLCIGIKHISIISVKNHETNITIKIIMQQLGEHHLELGKIIDEIIKCHKTKICLFQKNEIKAQPGINL